MSALQALGSPSKSPFVTKLVGSGGGAELLEETIELLNGGTELLNGGADEMLPELETMLELETILELLADGTMPELLDGTIEGLGTELETGVEEEAGGAKELEGQADGHAEDDVCGTP